MSKDVALYKTRLGRFYRTTVPENMRGFPKVGVGDFIEWVFDDGRVYVRRASSGVHVNG